MMTLCVTRLNFLRAPALDDVVAFLHCGSPLIRILGLDSNGSRPNRRLSFQLSAGHPRFDWVALQNGTPQMLYNRSPLQTVKSLQGTSVTPSWYVDDPGPLPSRCLL